MQNTHTHSKGTRVCVQVRAHLLHLHRFQWKRNRNQNRVWCPHLTLSTNEKRSNHQWRQQLRRAYECYDELKQCFWCTGTHVHSIECVLQYRVFCCFLLYLSRFPLNLMRYSLHWWLKVEHTWIFNSSSFDFTRVHSSPFSGSQFKRYNTSCIALSNVHVSVCVSLCIYVSSCLFSHFDKTVWTVRCFLFLSLSSFRCCC